MVKWTEKFGVHNLDVGTISLPCVLTVELDVHKYEYFIRLNGKIIKVIETSPDRIKDGALRDMDLNNAKVEAIAIVIHKVHKIEKNLIWVEDM
jgi:hypothetical protein